MENEVGSIELGKRADLQLVNLLEPHITPTVDLALSLVLYGSTGNVEARAHKSSAMKCGRSSSELDQS